MKNSVELLKEVRSNARWAYGIWLLGALAIALEKWMGSTDIAEIKQEGALWCVGFLFLFVGRWIVQCTEVIVAAIKEQKS